MAVGAYGDDGITPGNNAIESGAVYTYSYSGTWGNETILRPDELVDGDKFGYSVDLDNNWLIAGAPRLTSTSTICYAYIYQYSGGWTNKERIQSDGDTDNSFGFSVAIDGDNLRAVCGAAWELNKTGAAYVFEYTGSWSQTAALTASDGAINEYYGTTVAIDGNWIMTGAPERSTSGVYVYHDDGSNWNEERIAEAPDSGEFGSAIYFNNGRYVIAAKDKFAAFLFTGGIYIYD